jgi:hypothetical protein
VAQVISNPSYCQKRKSKTKQDLIFVLRNFKTIHDLELRLYQMTAKERRFILSIPFFLWSLRHVMSAVIAAACHLTSFYPGIHHSLLSLPHKFEILFPYTDMSHLYGLAGILILCALLSFDWHHPFGE